MSLARTSRIEPGRAPAVQVRRVERTGTFIIHPDLQRRIDLPGVGPCARPVDIDRALTGFAKLVSLRVYAFDKGVVIDGEAEGDEVFIVLMRGRADVAVSSGGREAGSFSLQQAGGTRVVYMPPHAAYRLTAVSDCDVAYARAVPCGTNLPAACGFVPAPDRLDITGHALSMNVAIATVQAGKCVSLGEDGRSSECFMHIRSNGMKATIAGERLHDWDSVAVADGESALLQVQAGSAEILTVSASRSEAFNDVIAK